MSDIVERLRRKAIMCDYCRGDKELLEEAADEIEFLNKVIEVERKEHKEAVEAERKKHEWYTVEEKLPENEEWVIAVDKDGYYYHQARLSDGTWEWAYEAGADYWEDIDEPVTYWTHFPDPPKGEEE